MQIRYLIVIFLIILVFGGLYFKFLYDVPDGEEGINNWVSRLLVVSGTIGLMITGLWKSRNPLEPYQRDEYSYYSMDNQNFNEETKSNVEEHEFRNRGETD